MDDSDKKNLPLATLFGIACVWFGSHVGGGFATGNQTWQYYSVYGWIALFTPLLAMLLLGWVLREAVIFAHANNTFTYDAFFRKLWDPYPKLEISFEVFFLIMLVVAVGVAIAGAASLFVQQGVPYGVAVLITGALLLVLTIFGAQILMRAATLMSVMIMLACGIIFFVGISAQSAGLTHLMDTAELPFGYWTPLTKVVIYAAFQVVYLPSYVACSTAVKTWKSVNTLTVMGIVMNALYLGAGAVLLLLWQGKGGLDFSTITLPNVAICTALGKPWLYWCYVVTLFIAFISTGVGCIFGMIPRLENKIMREHTGVFSNLTARRALISFVVMLVAMSISMAGLSNLVRHGYGYCGYLSIVAVILPVLIIGRIKNRRHAKANPDFFKS